MTFREIASFEVVHGQLEWPWMAVSAGGSRVAYASSAKTIATLAIESERVASGRSFTLSSDLALQGRSAGLSAFALSATGDRLAVTGMVDGGFVIAILEGGERRRRRLDDLLGPGHEVRAIAFARTERRLWLSVESATETVTALVDGDSLELVGAVRTPAFPRPALHELHLHPQDDAVLVLAACGEEGTFARVVGFAEDVVSVIPTALDAGGIPAGFVGYSADGARVHLVEADELRTHGWPTLDELSSVQLADDFVSSFSGAVLGNDILIDGEDAETHDDAVMLFDRSAIRGAILPDKGPPGMWAGRLGQSAIITIEPKGDPARARILLRTATPLGPAARHLLS